VVVARDTGPGEAWLHPSSRLLTLRRLEVGGVALVVAIAGGVGGGLAGGLPLALGCVVAACLVGLASAIFAGRRVAAWAYVEREDDLLVSRGVLVSRLSVVPYGRMQFIDVTAGPLERAFRLATVRMHTAAAASDARIPGLERQEATRLRDRLAALGEAQASGI
jgi:uncharacterized protein